MMCKASALEGRRCCDCVAAGGRVVSGCAAVACKTAPGDGKEGCVTLKRPECCFLVVKVCKLECEGRS